MKREKLNSLAKSLKEKNITFFCGAGISHYSGIPLANSLVKGILERLSMSNEEKEKFLKTNIPFESVIQTLLNVTKHEKLFKIFECNTPNRNQILFQKLAVKNNLSSVVTTNFDHLIENAFISGNIPYHTYYSDKEIANVNWSSDKIPIIKLHGDISDFKSLAITIRRVASQTLITNREKIIEEVFTHQNSDVVIVMGYSCSDQFDIIPTITSLEDKNKRVIFVDHASIPDSEIQITSLNEVSSNHAFYGFNGIKLKCNTDHFVEEIWDVLLETKIPQINRSKSTWKQKLDKWIEETVLKYSSGIKFYVASLLLQKSDSYKLSNHNAQKYLNKNPDSDLINDVFQLIGENYRELNEKNESEKWLNKILDQSNDKKQLSRAHRSLGILQLDRNNNSEAINFFERALEYSEEFYGKDSDEEFRGKCYGNIGIAYKKKGTRKSLNKSVENHERALKIADQIGDVKSKNRTLGNIGITYSDFALNYYNEALDIAKNLNDKKHEAIWSINIGIDLINRNDEKALKWLKKAKELFQEVGKTHRVKLCQEYICIVNRVKKISEY